MNEMTEVYLNNAFDFCRCGPLPPVPPFQKIQGNGTITFGDSITFDQLASTYENSSRYKLNAFVGGANVNYSHPGDGTALQLKLLMKNPFSVNRLALAYWAVGVNDIRSAAYNDPAQSNVVPFGALTFLTSAFSDVPIEATDDNVIKTGTWVAEDFTGVTDSSRFVPIKSVTLGDKIEWTFNGDNVYTNIFFQGGNQGGHVLADYKIYIDNVLKETKSCYGIDNSSNHFCFSRLFRGLGAGSHTIRIENFSNGGSTSDRALVIDCLGTLLPVSSSTATFVKAIRPFDFTIHAPNLEPERLPEINQTIHDQVNIFSSLGYPAYYNPSVNVTGGHADGLHLTDEDFEDDFQDMLLSPLFP